MDLESFQTDLSGSMDTLSSIGTNKTSSFRKRITQQQKELMASFMIENPELITHSSTEENEEELWNELVNKLNNLKPVKSLDHWKTFWQRWSLSLFSKTEANLMVLDSKLKNFLDKILKNSENADTEYNIKKYIGPRKRMSIDDINNHLIVIEKEKSKLHLEVDDNDFKILKYKNTIKCLENANADKRQKIKKLCEKKAYLNYKKRKFEDKKENAKRFKESLDLSEQMFQ